MTDVPPDREVEDAKDEAEAADEDRSPEGGPRVHTSPEEGHPAGTGERSDRDIGGPTSPEEPPEDDATGGAAGTRGSGLEPHE